MQMSPGDRVRIKQDAWTVTMNHEFLIAVAGSTARAISLQEYNEYSNSDKSYDFDEPPDKVRQWMDQRIQFPFRFEKVARRKGGSPFCRVDSVAVLDEKFFELVERNEYTC